MGVQLWAPPIPGPVQGPGQRTRLSPPVGGPGADSVLPLSILMEVRVLEHGTVLP